MRWFRRQLSRRLGRRIVDLRRDQPTISFTFDDFPQSALETGGAILRQHGVRGTYYAALGLMGTTAPVGPIFRQEHIQLLLDQGHELGCHTFAHCNSWETSPCDFEQSILENRRALNRVAPGAAFQTLSYPLTVPRPGTKRRAGRYFSCCRGGGQCFNIGPTDLNRIAAFFLEKSRDDIASVKKLIDDNHRAGGWLILATHDVCGHPTEYGCTPEFFEGVVRHAAESGSRLLRVAEALEAMRCGSEGAARRA